MATSSKWLVREKSMSNNLSWDLQEQKYIPEKTFINSQNECTLDMQASLRGEACHLS